VREKSSAGSVCTIAGTLLRSMPRPVIGVGATNWNVDGVVTPGADAGGEGAGRATGRAAAGRAGAGAVRRAGLGFVSLGAVTVTSGSVSDTWPQAGPGEVSTGNAPKATAPKSRRFRRSRDELRLITPHAPNITPQNFPKGHPELLSAYRLGKFWQSG
jgi:hypothetical protein